ncbi:hypothetical protein [Shinella sp.]|uniref:hypothetical protein n=1 Tax=Shinella sp. TaxID=1870904 RepID=UPI00301D86F9
MSQEIRPSEPRHRLRSFAPYHEADRRLQRLAGADVLFTLVLIGALLALSLTGLAVRLASVWFVIAGVVFAGRLLVLELALRGVLTGRPAIAAVLFARSSSPVTVAGLSGVLAVACAFLWAGVPLAAALVLGTSIISLAVVRRAGR